MTGSELLAELTASTGHFVRVRDADALPPVDGLFVRNAAGDTCLHTGDAPITRTDLIDECNVTAISHPHEFAHEVKARVIGGSGAAAFPRIETVRDESEPATSDGDAEIVWTTIVTATHFDNTAGTSFHPQTPTSPRTGRDE